VNCKKLRMDLLAQFRCQGRFFGSIYTRNSLRVDNRKWVPEQQLACQSNSLKRMLTIVLNKTKAYQPRETTGNRSTQSILIPRANPFAAACATIMISLLLMRTSATPASSRKARLIDVRREQASASGWPYTTHGEIRGSISPSTLKAS
jgi:hypothetical protein